MRRYGGKPTLWVPRAFTLAELNHVYLEVTGAAAAI